MHPIEQTVDLRRNKAMKEAGRPKGIGISGSPSVPRSIAGPLKYKDFFLAWFLRNGTVRIDGAVALAADR
jgi:hypothetical protein